MLRHILFFVFSFLTYTALGQVYVGKACIVHPSDPPPTASDGSPISCTEPTRFFERSSNVGGSWSWDFGDGAVSNYIGRETYHTYDFPGDYIVSAQVIGAGGVMVKIDTDTVKVRYYPRQPLFEKKLEVDTMICNGNTITLNPFKGTSATPGVEYKWFPNGDTTATIDVSEPGCYSVEVIDPITGCSRSAKINVKVCQVDPPSSGGQETWYFGYGSGLQFELTGTEVLQDSLDNDGSLNPQPEIEDPAFNPSTPAINNNFRADEAAAVVLNSGNGVVLYTDGKKLFSGEDDSEIENVDGSPFVITGNVGAQGLALVPQPKCSSCDFVNYLLYTVDENTGLLTYSVIDMRYNDRKGAVTETGIPVGVEVSGKIIAERNGDDESYVIQAYNKEYRSFQSIRVDSLGVTGVSPVLGSLPYGTISPGYVSISSDGRQLVQGYIEGGSNFIEIYDRNPDNGSLSNRRVIPLNEAAPPTVYGLAFSPNGQFVYVTLNGGGAADSKLLQVDLSNNTVEAIASGPEEFGAVALGPKYGAGSKYVYVVMKDKNEVHYLQDPDEKGRNAVAFTYNSSGGGTPVAGTTKLGFPNVVAPQQEDDGGGGGAGYSGNCFNVPTILTMQAICDPFENEVEWTVEGEKTTGAMISHTFSRPGWHEVYISVTVRERGTTIAGVKIPGAFCTTVLDTGRIYIKPAPSMTIPDPLYVCLEPPLNDIPFDPKPTGGNSFEFDWMTSLGVILSDAHDRPPTYVFKIPGTYKLRVTNDYTCETEADIKVDEGCEPVLYFPDVITPDGLGPTQNEKFNIIYYFIERPRLEIYNRWGEQIFETDNLDVQWGGTYKDKPVLANQLYAYVLRYYSRDFPQRGEQRKVGSILVLRDGQ